MDEKILELAKQIYINAVGNYMFDDHMELFRPTICGSQHLDIVAYNSFLAASIFERYLEYGERPTHEGFNLLNHYHGGYMRNPEWVEQESASKQRPNTNTDPKSR